MKTISELAVRWFDRHPDALTRSQRREIEQMKSIKARMDGAA